MNNAIFIKWLLDSVENYPQRVAVIDQRGNRKTTYKELYEMACRVVGYVNSLHLPAHSFIGICLPTSMEYIAAEIGIWLSGNAILPLGIEFPESRIQQIMEHSESPLLIDESVMNEIISFEPQEPLSLPEEDDINSLFYTSGSTGSPKGVLHSFRSFGIPLFPDDMFKELNVSLMAVTAPMFFVACKLIYDFLTRGGTVNIVPPDVRIDIRKLETFIAEQNIEFVFVPPSVLPHFQNKSHTLKVVFTASERVSGVGPKGYKLINYCGQTETAGIGATFVVDKPYDNTPIGIPVKPYIYSVRDEDGNEVTPGEEGELCYQGDLTPGYFKDPKRTAELYRGGWLHTGDIVRARPDGNLILINRKDWMLKINGQRVEPSEVETVLKKMPGIDNAIVKGFTAGNSRQYLCAYYISEEGVEEESILDYLSSKLPSYMVPVYFVKMDSFPVNMNGKLDRNSLVSPASDDEIIDREPYEAPKDDIEKQLCKAFESTLGYRHIGVNEDFFLIGGDSIRVMKLQTLCPNLPLSARKIYVHRTPRNIAKACRESIEISREQRSTYPLSKTQMGIYAESMLHQGETIYNNAVLYRLGKHVDKDRLARAFEQLIEVHPFLKMRLFIDDNGSPCQSQNTSSIYHQQIEHVSEEQFLSLKSDLVRPFDILSEPLFRIRIIVTPSDAYLFMDFHHIIFDGYSYNILTEDLNTLYDGNAVDVESFSGYDVAEEEQHLRTTEAFDDARSWNRMTFGDVEIDSLPEGDMDEGSEQEWGSMQIPLSVDYQQLSSACQRLDVTPNVLMTSAFGYLLGEYSFLEESLFATIYNGRKDLRTIRTIGMMVKTLAVHAKWDERTSIYEYLHNMKHQLLASMNNDLFSFAELSEMNHHVNSHVLFAYQGDFGFPDVLCGEKYEQLPIKSNATGEDLAVEVLRNGSQLLSHIEYAGNRYSQQFIRAFIETFDSIVCGFAAENSKKINLRDISLLKTDALNRIVSLGRGDVLNYDTSETFVSQFLRQARLHPDSVAVVDSESSISYSELDRQSDLLAHKLIEAGVVPDSFVALILPRSKEFVIAMMAVMKCGAAFIPLDSEYPDSRIRYILDDAHIVAIITKGEHLNHCSFDIVPNIISLDDINFSAYCSPVCRCIPSSLAYMIYTSGSTGSPKGVVVAHSALLNFITWLSDVEELKPGDQCALHTSFCFDGSMFDLFPPLVNGATLHILSGSLRHDMNGLYQYICDNHIAGMLLTTQFGMAMLEQYDLPMRFLMLGGEKLTAFKPSAVKLYNCYGPTEFTVCATYHKVNQGRTYRNIPIGRTVPNCTSYVVDIAGRLLPQGAIGELCLSGRQLSNGYWNRHQLTDKKFTVSPSCSNKKIYHTGDLVRWNAFGELEYQGRIDNLVKLRGYRIELGEIENKIKSYDDVISSVVMVHHEGNRELLVGFYCASRAIDRAALLDYLNSQLPSYMVPQILIQLDKIPVSLNGKTDYKALQGKVSQYDVIQSMKVMPSNDSEQKLYTIAKELLGTDNFGVTDDLTLIGLSSLLAIKMCFLAEKAGLTLNVNSVLKYKSIRLILSQETSIGSWENEYDFTKPVAVLIQGLTSYSQLEALKDSLCSHYSVILIGPIEEHIKRFSSDRMVMTLELVDLYVGYLSSQLPHEASVSLFIGHSFGGELAYRCAVRYHSMTGQSPLVCMLDTYSNLQSMTDASIEHLSVPVELDADMPAYQGSAILFKATRQAENMLVENHEKLSRESDEKWRSLISQLKTRLIEADHFSMLEKRFATDYLELIDKEVTTITKP